MENQIEKKVANEMGTGLIYISYIKVSTTCANKDW